MQGNHGKPRASHGEYCDRLAPWPIQTATFSQSSIEVLHLPKPDFRFFSGNIFFGSPSHANYPDFIKCQPRMEKNMLKHQG